ncbi:N-acetylmuramic acid 6-phosphate etherase [Clostridium frigidicarnis]|uniref:N-acetylmuramic acid 6-phosphate etherase n=1 Tax=Clostridium frigidicarnis TaxID=84698 RepID=A0A1I0YDG7_9CLOT|nr:N-acetylmuramic acid 6-phosphate etherase [Clostridium frigidicarnis]SFB10837.1 N-acetylmuramic acid 6-phosphate etherase [Clostridium frigidicarnis]
MIIDLKRLDTEKVNKNTVNIDKVSTIDMVRMINKEDYLVAEAVEKEIKNIANAVDLIHGKLSKGGRLIYIGAGNSGRLGVLDACECPPTFGVSEDKVIGILSGGYEATVRANEGSEDIEDGAIKELKEIDFCENDCLVGLSASGRTPYVKGALKYAKEIGASHIAVSCSRNAEISTLAEVAIEIVTGAEVITGSTRLKAGTAQKMVLNMLSTGSMIKCGKVYGNYMVDVRAKNNKLVERSKKIIVDCTNVDRETAEEYLNECDGKVKVAVVSILSGLNKKESIKILEENENTIYKALNALKRN